jgi:hypothetical protein
MPILDKRNYRERDPWRDKIFDAARKKLSPPARPKAATVSSWEPPPPTHPDLSEQAAPATETSGVEETSPFLTFLLVILVAAVVVAAGLVVVERAWLNFILERLSS